MSTKNPVNPATLIFGAIILLSIVFSLGGYLWYSNHLKETSTKAVAWMPNYCPGSVDHALARFLNAAQTADVNLGMFGTTDDAGQSSFALTFQGSKRQLAALQAAIEVFRQEKETCINGTALEYNTVTEQYYLSLYFKGTKVPEGKTIFLNLGPATPATPAILPPLPCPKEKGDCEALQSPRLDH